MAADTDPRGAVVTHRPDIEGLRGLAVLAVVLFHARLEGFSGGFVGVDIFFVISGFLIASIVAAELEAGRFSVFAFYERRVRRILPAFFVVMAGSSLLAWFLLTPSALIAFGRSLLAASAFGSNVLFARENAYFAAAAHSRPLLHTWSLGVEEQFYLAFPWLMLVAVRWGRAGACRVLQALCVISFIACVWMTGRDEMLAFYLLPFRAWELLLGAVLALAVTKKVDTAGGRWRDAAAMGGLALILSAVVGFSDATTFPGVAAVVPCLGAALIIGAGIRSTTLVGQWLSAAPLTLIGRMSYSLYLWHWPLISLAGWWLIEPMTRMQSLAVVALAAVLALATWTFVEEPCRRRPADPSGVRRWPAFASAAIATLLAIAFAASIRLTGGYPSRVSETVRALDAARDDRAPDWRRCQAEDRRPIAYDDQCVYGARDVAPRVAVWGDSFATELAAALGAAAEAQGESLLAISYAGCPPSVDVAGQRPSCAQHNATVLARVMADPRITRMILVARYQYFLNQFGTAFLAGFETAARALHHAGKEIIVTYPIPRPPADVPTLLARHAQTGRAPADVWIDARAYRRDNAAVIAMLDRLTRVEGMIAVHPDEILCGPSRCDVYRDGRVLYFDDNHLSLAGATLVRQAFAVPPGAPVARAALKTAMGSPEAVTR